MVLGFKYQAKFVATVLAFTSLAAPANAQNIVDPSSIALDEWNMDIFKSNRDQLIMFYTSSLKNFAPDGERLNLSTLDALIALKRSAQRGNSVGRFLAYDLNWDGRITRSEYNSVFEDNDQFSNDNADAWDLGGASNDLNGDDVVTIEELQAVVVQSYPDDRPVSKEIEEMRYWDLDGDGFITVSEIADVVDANVTE